MSEIVPIPKIPITVRAGTMDDLPFIDALQKKNTKQVGFMPMKQFEGKIKLGHVLIAEELTADYADNADKTESDSHSSAPSALSAVRNPVGYLIGNDQYFKRDDVGIIYQINIVEGKRRSLVGATLLKAQFDRSAYGCKLYCCWCAQDIEANHFWESLGFIPLAFRAGSAKKSRVHIFWQRRIREGDTTTPYWFPAQTNSGSIREDRIVLPIPPGTHWRDVMPVVLPGAERGALPDGKRGRGAHATENAPTLRTPTQRRVQFGRPSAKPAAAPQDVAKKEKPKKPKLKNDPKLVAAARELRDRWLEKVNSDPTAIPIGAGKYQVCRQIEANVTENRPARLLDAA